MAVLGGSWWAGEQYGGSKETCRAVEGQMLKLLVLGWVVRVLRQEVRVLGQEVRVLGQKDTPELLPPD